MAVAAVELAEEGPSRFFEVLLDDDDDVLLFHKLNTAADTAAPNRKPDSADLDTRELMVKKMSEIIVWSSGRTDALVVALELPFSHSTKSKIERVGDNIGVAREQKPMTTCHACQRDNSGHVTLKRPSRPP